ncbi:hypothetical protein JTE90_018221 [Oedothorax gibbosus]|uniref:Uncharacterized protein n=1 Tax=Oedothorax gibbosus TaxID=931172 RepID=A0AAV6U9U1_9ARAC|nr:hypothetical protein JTE90_018221 [Oedothorax gibbosus]
MEQLVAGREGKKKLRKYEDCADRISRIVEDYGNRSNVEFMRDDKEEMETIIDSLVTGSKTSKDVPVIQKVRSKKSRTFLHQQDGSAVEMQQSKRQKTASIKVKKGEIDKKMIAALKDRIMAMESLKPARAPPIADQEVENLEVSFLKKQVAELAGQLNAKEEAADHYRLKYKKKK